MSSRFVNPLTDLGFKIIFGQPASKDLLIILLNELLSGEHLSLIHSYLAEQNQDLRLTGDAMRLVLEDFMAQRCV